MTAKNLNGENRNLLVEPHMLKYERPKRQRGRAKVCRIIGSCERQPKDMPKFSQTDGQTPHRQSVLVGGSAAGRPAFHCHAPSPRPTTTHYNTQKCFVTCGQLCSTAVTNAIELYRLASSVQRLASSVQTAAIHSPVRPVNNQSQSPVTGGVTQPKSYQNRKHSSINMLLS